MTRGFTNGRVVVASVAFNQLRIKTMTYEQAQWALKHDWCQGVTSHIGKYYVTACDTDGNHLHTGDYKALREWAGY
jgi:PHP family Zn ribbon phosphoesterase